MRWNPTLLPTLLGVAITLSLPATAPARDAAIGTVRTAIAVRLATLQSATPAAARAMLARIDRAAMRACGAEPGSLRDLREAVRGSACHHAAVFDAVRRIDSPMLRRAYGEGPAPRLFDTAAACTKETPCPACSN